ncbi:MAG: helix-turn-helix domain-containing protein, partial [bacterium]
AVLLADNGTIKPDHLPETLLRPKKVHTKSFQESVLSTMEMVEKAYIYWMLRSHNWHKEKSAELLGIDPSTLHRKIERYHLSKSE